MEFLKQVEGEPLWGLSFAASMPMLQFGKRVTSRKRSGQTITIGFFTLHLQCPWRLHDGTTIIAGSDDKSHTALDVWIRKEPRARTVQRDALGGFSIEFEDERVLEAFPALSAVDEYAEFWRLIVSDGDARKHFVVSGRGVEVL